jgi:glycosyltransferase involved in cell wall biosynthesis
MKVLMMHRDDGKSGGAQIQMNRLREGLRGSGIDAKIVCREGGPDESTLLPFRPVAEKWLGALTRRIGLNDVHLISSFDLPGLDDFKNADLIDLHCLHSGTFSYLALPAITAVKPTIFTFHDMWPITGHCHASLECDRWKTGCGKCPHPEIEPAVKRDATAIEWWLKRRAYRKSNFTIVTPSKWLADRVGESPLLDGPVHCIPHGVDTAVFKPLDQSHCRELLGVPEGKIVLLCAIEHMDRPLKGADLLVKALDFLPKAFQDQCVLLLFGHPNRRIQEQISLPIIDLGYINEDRLKAVAYSAADLLINPTRAESFGLVALESMACGTPVAAFKVGGIPELVRPGVTGLLAKPDDPEGLAACIQSMAGDPVQLQSMADRCRDVATTEYTLTQQVRRTIELYQYVLSEADPMLFRCK